MIYTISNLKKRNMDNYLNNRTVSTAEYTFTGLKKSQVKAYRDTISYSKKRPEQTETRTQPLEKKTTKELDEDNQSFISKLKKTLVCAGETPQKTSKQKQILQTKVQPRPNSALQSSEKKGSKIKIKAEVKLAQ